MKAKLSLGEALATKFAVGFRIQNLTDKILELTSIQPVTTMSDEDSELLKSINEELDILKSAQKKLFYFTSVEL